MQKSVKAMLRAAKRRSERFAVQLDCQDLYDECDAQTETLAQIDRAAHPDEFEAKQAEVSALVEKIYATVIHGRFQVLPFMQWQALCADHPAREGSSTDAQWGVNVETFFPEAVRLCMVEPVMDDDDWGAFIDLLSDGEWTRLSLQVWVANGRPVDIPKLPSASSTTMPSG